MLNNPARADAVQDHIRRAVATLTAQGKPRTKRAVADAAGCSPTTVMKYRAIWQGDGGETEMVTVQGPLALTPENVSAWQELEAQFAPMSIGARILGCQYDQVTPRMAACWLYQYRRLQLLGMRYAHLGLTPRTLRPYKDRVAVLEEAAVTRCSRAAFKTACGQQKALRVLQLPLPADQRFLDLPFPAAAWQFLAEAMVPVEGQRHLEAGHVEQQ